jgi:hypothetical protein
VLVLQGLQHVVVELTSLRVAEGEDVIEVGRQASPDGDQQGVVAQLAALACTHDAARAIDRRQRVLEPIGFEVSRDVPERIATRRAESDGLANGEWPVDELLVWRQERHLYAILREASQA